MAKQVRHKATTDIVSIRIRSNSHRMPLEQAVDEAVRECIHKDILSDVLSEERSAVMLEMLTTFDEKVYEDGLREEGMEIGMEKGMEKGMGIGIGKGVEIGMDKKGVQVYINMRRDGISREKAQVLAELSDELADEAETKLAEVEK